MNCPYSSLQNDLEHEIAARPSRGSGHALRFSVRLIPYRIKIAYEPVQVKAFKDIHPSKAPVSLYSQRLKPAKPRI